MIWFEFRRNGRNGGTTELQLIATEARRHGGSTELVPNLEFTPKLKLPLFFCELRNSGGPQVVPLLTKTNKDSQFGGTSVRSTPLAFELRVSVPPWQSVAVP